MVLIIADGRPAVLRHGLPDQRLAHVLRVLARPRGSRPPALDPAQPPPGADLLGAVHGRLALLITLPALKGDENNYTYAFFAVVSIAVIGLYIAYVIPIFLRWRKGDEFEPGPGPSAASTSG